MCPRKRQRPSAPEPNTQITITYKQIDVTRRELAIQKLTD